MTFKEKLNNVKKNLKIFKRKRVETTSSKIDDKKSKIIKKRINSQNEKIEIEIKKK